MLKIPKILIIAGSDSGGGAGIQGDIKTVTCLGGYAASAITALTAQNTMGVYGVLDVPEKFIEQQIRLVLDDIGADALKTGMLSKASIVEVVADTISDYSDIPLVLDPVMFAKGGAPLLAKEAIDTLKSLLIPLARIITPNVPEAEFLADMEIKNTADMRNAAEKIMRMGCEAVLVKGGHLESEILSDVLLTTHGETIYTQTRIASKNTHGTGCALASAIATEIGRGLELPEAVAKARDFVRGAIENSPQIGKGSGAMWHGYAITGNDL